MLKIFRGDTPDAVEPLSDQEKSEARELVDALVAQVKDATIGPSFFVTHVKPKEFPAGRDILDSSPRTQLAITLDALTTPLQDNYSQPERAIVLRSLLKALLRRDLPYDEATIHQMLLSAGASNIWELPTGSILGCVGRFVNKHGLSPRLRKQLESLHRLFHSGSDYAEERKIGERIEAILSDTAKEGKPHSTAPFELNTGEAWTDALLVELGRLDDEARGRWQAYLDHCRTAKSSKPSKRWLTEVGSRLDAMGAAQVTNIVCNTLAHVGRPGATRKLNYGGWTHYAEPTQIHDTHANLLRGMVWSTSMVRAEMELKDQLITAVGDAAELCFQKIPNVGPRSPKVGNACLQALASMEDLSAIAQLGRLKSRAKHASTRKQIARALEQAAEKVGMTQDDLEETAVPTYGLTEVGRYTEQIGEFTVELTVQSTGKPELAWIKPNGKRQKTVPVAVKTELADNLKTLKKRVKDIGTFMPSLHYRVESLFLNQRSWSLADFRSRFLDHPLVGVVARRLIWQCTASGESATGIWQGGQFVAADSRPIEWIDDTTTVAIWHPIHSSAEDVLAWRNWLLDNEVCQPFKQAHREIYVLTDAERQTDVYSNRFAAHIIRQHQFAALCQQRGWRYQVQGEWDSSNVPYLELPQHNLCAEFWVDPIEDANEVSESFVYVYLSTDQVRFRQLGAHGPQPLEQVPALVFSEVMRDIDLFVGVASVANDPNWVDGGPQGLHRQYWDDVVFGDLSQSAQTRREVLERVIPRLKIADRCRFDDKFLIVEGRLRTYKIHLGSGNILMLPNDQYLCIVPKRGAGTKRTDSIYLPFEGDSLLSVILSKAFLLADDDKIKDPTIRAQIGV